MIDVSTLENIIYQIAKRSRDNQSCYSPEINKQILSTLNSTDWEQVVMEQIASEMAEEERRQKEYSEKLIPCVCCRELERRDVLLSQDGRCKPCQQETWDKFSRPCMVCDAMYLPRGDFDREYSVCYAPRCEKIKHQVWSQVGRACKANQPASLTIQEWIQAIKFFDWKCAYCQEKPYIIMEHYISIPQAGTTSDNCVPACYKCNARKSDRHPDNLGDLFPAENLARIRTYLYGDNGKIHARSA